jgi:hypothetical protein
VTLLGHSVDWVTVHQASFAAFAVSAGLHVLGRLVPALRLVQPRAGRRVAGGTARVLALLLAMAVAGGAASFVLDAAGSWRHQQSDVESGP